MKFQGFIGPSYNLPNKPVDVQRSINIYPEIVESGTGKEAQVAYFKSSEGLKLLFELGQGPIRLIYFDGLEKDDGTYFQQNRVFVVSGSKVFRLTWNGLDGWNTLELGELGTSEGQVSAASLSIDFGVTVFVDGSDENYVYHKTDSSTETFESFTDAGYEPIERATQVIWLDGYLIFQVEDSNQFYVNEWNSLNVPALNFASAEGSPDNIVSIISNNRDLWLLNERSVELWANTGNADFPFERMQGGFIENGCLAPFSVAKIDGLVFWLGRNSNGQGVIYAASGANHQRISTHAIERQLLSFQNIENAKAYTYQIGGHSFYLINFEETSYVYDLTTKMWHERMFTNDGVLERHRGEHLVFFPDFGRHIVGDYENAKLYYLDTDTYADDDAPLTRMRVFPHVSNGLKNVFVKSLQLDMETGIGLVESTEQGYDPQVMMRFSDDGGKTWSNETWVSAGKLGEYKTRCIWRRLGRSRDRVFEISMSDPVSCTWLSAEIELEAGRS